MNTLSRKGYDKYKYVSDHFVERNGGQRRLDDEADEDGDEEYEEKWSKVSTIGDSKRISKLRKKLSVQNDGEIAIVEDEVYVRSKSKRESPKTATVDRKTSRRSRPSRSPSRRENWK